MCTSKRRNVHRLRYICINILVIDCTKYIHFLTDFFLQILYRSLAPLLMPFCSALLAHRGVFRLTCLWGYSCLVCVWGGGTNHHHQQHPQPQHLRDCGKRYASLFFVACIDQDDNELITLEKIHLFVEVLDRYFGNVCELDIIFNFHKAYYILDELFIGGELQVGAWCCFAVVLLFFGCWLFFVGVHKCCCLILC